MAKNVRKGICKVIAGDPFEVQNRQQSLKSRNSSQIWRQNGASEPLAGSAIKYTRLADLDVADPGLEQARSPITVSNDQQAAADFLSKKTMVLKILVYFVLDRSLKHLSCVFPQIFFQSQPGILS